LPGTLHQKNRANPQLVTFHALSGVKAYSFDDVMRDIPGLAPRLKKASATVGGRRVSWQNLRVRLSYIHPQFDGNRPAQYPALREGKEELNYDSDAWLSIALCLRDGDIPLLEDHERDWLELIEEWSNGTLWRERTGEEL